MNMVESSDASLALLGDIESAEKAMLQLPQVECPVIHHFGPGIYIREVHIPAGSLAIGHHQNFDHMNFFIKGRVVMLNADGSTSELVAPMLFTGKPGRKIGYVLEDVVWQNIYPSDETDVSKLEDKFITKSDAWLEHDAAIKELASFRSQVDRDDYMKVISHVGMNEDQVRSMVENEEDQIHATGPHVPFVIGNSQIEGKGYFITKGVDSGELIAIARINGKRTPAGRYVNHSASPNARMVKTESGDIALVAIRRIKGSVRGGFGDEVTVDYLQALSESRIESSVKEESCQP